MCKYLYLMFYKRTIRVCLAVFSPLYKTFNLNLLFKQIQADEAETTQEGRHLQGGRQVEQGQQIRLNSLLVNKK